MNLYERVENYKNEDFSNIIIFIRNGTIKCGKHAHLVKIDKNYKIDEKELFNNEQGKYVK